MKKGISLIVLVITIIVMIILAASVVITLSNSGVIDRASYAVELTDEKQVQDLAALAWAEAYLDENRVDPIEDVVKEKLENQGVVLTDWNITVTDTGVNILKKETEKIIEFMIDGTTYQAVEGMTWQEWVDSDYDNDEYYHQALAYPSGSPIIKNAVLGAVRNSNGNNVMHIDEIVANDNYIYFEADV